MEEECLHFWHLLDLFYFVRLIFFPMLIISFLVLSVFEAVKLVLGVEVDEQLGCLLFSVLRVLLGLDLVVVEEELEAVGEVGTEDEL